MEWTGVASCVMSWDPGTELIVAGGASNLNGRAWVRIRAVVHMRAGDADVPLDALPVVIRMTHD